MTDDERQNEIDHLKGLLSILVKKRRWYEIQLARFEGPLVPFHLADDLDRTKAEIEKTELRLVQLGEVSYFPASLVDRVTALERQVAELRGMITLQPRISHGSDWFLVTEDTITIHGQTYLVEALFPYHIPSGYAHGEALDPVPTFSGDGEILALVFGATFAHQIQPLRDHDPTYPRARLIVFHHNSPSPVFVSSDDTSVYSGPAISFNSR